MLIPAVSVVGGLGCRSLLGGGALGAARNLDLDGFGYFLEAVTAD